jgi:hypothetical protein
MLGYIEDHAKGQIMLEIRNFNGNKLDIRRHLYKQFGAGTGGEIHHKERHYEKGMPKPGQLAFPKVVDMSKKLRQLGGRRLYFFKMCEASKRDTYTFCQENKLVRIVLENVGPEYKNCITRVLDMAKVSKMILNSSGVEDGEIPDAYDRSFSDAWLPSWKLLRMSLINEYKSKTKALEERAEEKKSKDKLPVAVGGFGTVQCYGCGGPHKKGDPSCTASPYDVHECAPPEFKVKQEDKKRKYDGKSQGGKGRGYSQPQKKQHNDEKKHCHHFNFGKGGMVQSADLHTKRMNLAQKKRVKRGKVTMMLSRKSKWRQWLLRNSKKLRPSWHLK